MSGLSVRRLLSLSALLFGARLAGAGLGFATQLLLARLLSSDGLGIFFLATSLAAVLGIVAASGYPSVAVRFVARYRDRSRSALLATFVHRARRDTIRTAAAISLGAMALCVVWPWGDAQARFAVACGAASVPAVALIRLNGSLAVAVRQFNLSWLPDLLVRPVLFLAALAGMAAFGIELSVVPVVALATLATVAIALGQAARLSPQLAASGAVPDRDRRLRPHWRSASRPLVIVALFTALFADFDVAILGGLLPPSELARFGICLKLAFLVGFAIQLVQEFAAPDIAEGYSRGEPGLAERSIARANCLAVTATLVAVAGAAVAGDRLLAAFGPDFVAGHAALVALAAAQVVRAGFGPSLQLLTQIGAQRQIAAVFAASAGVLVAANLVLVPGAGILGAALAVVLTTAFWTTALAVTLHRRAGLRTDMLASLSVLRIRPVLPQAPLGRGIGPAS